MTGNSAKNHIKVVCNVGNGIRGIAEHSR